jgi:hypothetical protein
MKEEERALKFVEILHEAARQGLISLESSGQPTWSPMMACGCGKNVSMTDMPKKRNPKDEEEVYIDNVCVGCEGNFPRSAVLICGKCKVAVGRIAAGTLPSGFVFKQGDVYHLDKCPSCTKGCESSVLLEQALYEKTT